MGNFKVFGDAVRARFGEMSGDPLFVVASDREEIWARYLTAFPAGSDPVFRTRTEHDCSCCRHFLRSVGAVVAVQNGALVSVWDLNGLPSPYQEVADAMAEYVRSLPIRDVFLTKVAKHGSVVSHEQTETGVRTWDHFAVEVPRQFVAADHAEKCGEARTTAAVLLRGLTELDPGAVETVADLIQSGALYRGEEHRRAVEEFQTLQSRVLAAGARQRIVLTWANVHNPVARFRNTVIGTLVQEISEGKDLEAAVRAFEAKVAPQNYKRPTALITKKMVTEALETIRSLGLETALERRHARFSDVSVNSVLFVDGRVRGALRGGLEDRLMEEVRPAAFDPKKAEEIRIEDFLGRVLPETRGLDLYLENGHVGNFVSLTAPVHPDAGHLFKWGNDFAWSYDGNVADSIRDRVKRAGGRVEDVSLRVSLAWTNTDDLDLHVLEPDGNHIYFGNKSQKLDVDMNVGHMGLVRDPVENVRWVRPPPAGRYRVVVHSYTRREAVDVGFVVEVESPRGLETLRFEKALPGGKEQHVADLLVQGGLVRSLAPGAGMVVGLASQEKWGLRTLELARVNSVVLSPNYWDDHAVGNRHWFFLLEGCRNPLPTRGIYNEFLAAGMEKHRKVFEVLGDKTKCPVVDEQLSGVGFSSTRRDKVTVVATGPGWSRPYTVAF